MAAERSGRAGADDAELGASWSRNTAPVAAKRVNPIRTRELLRFVDISPPKQAGSSAKRALRGGAP
jgi:hypothetical protein